MMRDPRIARLVALIMAAIKPPSGVPRIALALGMGLVCYIAFAVASWAIIAAMVCGLC